MAKQKRTLIIVAIVAGILVLAAATVLAIFPYAMMSSGDGASGSILKKQESPRALLKAYRRAMDRYKMARISPLFRKSAEKGEEKARERVDTAFTQKVSSGFWGNEAAGLHLGLLKKLAGRARWRCRWAQRAVQYGRFAEALNVAEQGTGARLARVAVPAALALGKLPALKRWLKRATVSDAPADPAFRQNAAMLQLALGDVLRVESWLARKPKGEDVSFIRAELLRRQGKQDAARKLLKTLIGSGQNTQPHFLESYCLSVHDSKAAETDFALLEKALGSPGLAKDAGSALGALMACAQALERHGKRPKAMEVIVKTLENVKVRYEPIYQLQYQHPIQNNAHPERFVVPVKLVRAELQRAAPKDKPAWATRLVQLLVLKARSHIAVLDAGSAHNALKEAATVGVDVPAIRYYQAVAFQVEGKMGKATRLVEQAVKAHPAQFGVFHARIALRAGKLKFVGKFVGQLKGIPKELEAVAGTTRALAAALAGTGTVRTAGLSFNSGWLKDHRVFRNSFMAKVARFYPTTQTTPDWVLAVLKAHPEAAKEAPFLLGFMGYDEISPLSALIHAHLLALEASSRGDDLAVRSYLGRVDGVQALFLKEPFWRLLWRSVLIKGKCP